MLAEVAYLIALAKQKKHTTQNDNGTLVTGNTFVVRNESDIEKIAIEINKLRVRKNRGLRGLLHDVRRCVFNAVFQNY